MFYAGYFRHRLDLDLHAQIAQDLWRPGQSFIGGVPTHQPPEQAHVRALRVVGGWERAVAIKLDQHPGELTPHEVPGQAPDAQRRGAMGTRRPAHHGADHVVENADRQL